MSISLIKPDLCRACKHFNALPKDGPGKDEGECKAMPPQIVAFVTPGAGGMPALNVQTIFPRVPPDWSCGCYKPRIMTTVQ